VTLAGLFINADETRELAPGDRVFTEGDAGVEMYGVIFGAIELRRRGATLTRIEADGTFGELALIDSSPRSLTAVAVEPTRIAVIDRRTFLFLVHETPTFALHVMRSMAARIRELGDRHESTASTR
jgi:CRP/FNR family cyclic AMP-dependent transcriptional regulator